MTTELKELMTKLVRRNGSDLHLTGDTIPYFRIQGQILPASSEVYEETKLRKDLEGILSVEKLKVFESLENDVEWF